MNTSCKCTVMRRRLLNDMITLGTEEMLKSLKTRHGAEHGMRYVDLLRWHLELAEGSEVVDKTIWRRSCFVRHREVPLYTTKPCVDQADSVRMLGFQGQLPRSTRGPRCGMMDMRTG